MLQKLTYGLLTFQWKLFYSWHVIEEVEQGPVVLDFIFKE